MKKLGNILQKQVQQMREKMEMKMSDTDKFEVRAISLGYYGGKLRQKSDEFTLIDPDHFSSSWMERTNIPVTSEKREMTNEASDELINELKSEIER